MSIADGVPDWTRVATQDAYRQVRRNVVDLIGQYPDSADVVVPACPEWTVLDLVEHLAGTLDLVLRRMNGAAPVLTRPVNSGPPRDTPETIPTGFTTLAELAGYWTASNDTLDRRIAAEGEPPIERLAMDAFIHEVDIRYALGVEVPPAHPAYPVVFDVVPLGFSWSVDNLGLPALRLRTPGGSWVAGTGEPAGTVSGNRLDLLRSLVGRRSPEQIAALSWTSDPAPWLPAFTWGPFHPPEHPVEDVSAPAAA
ncbi:MAG: maleylpyruvate isomerase family mycothiol-dependent enzyme [Labedaea sp.]